MSITIRFYEIDSIDCVLSFDDVKDKTMRELMLKIANQCHRYVNGMDFCLMLIKKGICINGYDQRHVIVKDCINPNDILRTINWTKNDIPKERIAKMRNNLSL